MNKSIAFKRLYKDYTHRFIKKIILASLLSIIVALLIMARNATVRRGSRSEYEWDEYSDYLDEDEYEDSDDEDEFSEESTTVAATESNSSSVESTSADGWTQGSDGVWWWQNQEDGSWWYKDANGEIVQYK